ncbi:hypothetical protein HDF10_001750 [Edaphobacter lichenicola]|uniref:Beta-galactosidase n=2 Tax=Tunturiibacter TaxID=3154218 RepID=A0A7W8N5A1_9BACT|nr:hypothetical protein [Edaphobacter lichenicola]
MWPQLLDRSKALGVNCISTYVFWNVHEPERDRYDFTGGRDLAHFLQLCQERELLAFLRVGPYCCAEWNFGGFPSYLRDEPNIELRTMNNPYLDRVEKYFDRLAEEIRPYLAPNGGPVAMIQVENEYANVAKRYGEAGQEYLRWIVNLAERVGFKIIPTTTCEGGASGSIETLNGNDIPPERAAGFRLKHPKEPMIWSELYPGWYDTWGHPRHTGRDGRELATCILEFLAEGGAGWNYYMWHGGTNFGRDSMYLQTTSYDFTAPLDEYGRCTPKGEYLGQLHKKLVEHRLILLEGNRTSENVTMNFQKTTWTRGFQRLELLVNRGKEPQTDASGCSVSPGGACLRSGDGDYIFHTDQIDATKGPAHDATKWNDISPPLMWSAWHEPLPPQRDRASIVRSSEPIEQLKLTKDKTDYCWYSTTINTWKGEELLAIPYGGDFLYVYVDGELVSQSVAPLLENRGFIVPSGSNQPMVVADQNESSKTDGYRHQFNLSGMKPGRHRLEILATAIGMVKGDWQITAPMNMERKGIWNGVLLDGDSLNTEWFNIPFLYGEKIHIATGPERQKWLKVPEIAKPLTWYRATFNLSDNELAHDSDYRIDAAGLWKGSLFVNGHAIGRYWLIGARDSEADPTQSHYHVPSVWLKRTNVLIVFEENAVIPSKVRFQRRLFSA